MAEQCPHCVDRLRQRLGPAAADLGGDPIRLPDRRLHGEQGRLGPLDWWRLPRSDGRWLTVWRLAPADGPTAHFVSEQGPLLPADAPAVHAAPWHASNWQRAWRQVEPAVLAAPPSAAASRP